MLKKLFGKTYSILVVDDKEENLELMKTNLKQISNVSIDLCKKSSEAEDMIRNVEYSLIILDIQMPNMDGYELATRIKSGYYKKNMTTPLIFVTGIYYSDIDKLKGYTIGSVDYIVKPISEDFIRKVKKYIKVDGKGDMTKSISKQRNLNIKKSLKF